jgi:hypothetical protein
MPEAPVMGECEHQFQPCPICSRTLNFLYEGKECFALDFFNRGESAR